MTVVMITELNFSIFTGKGFMHGHDQLLQFYDVRAILNMCNTTHGIHTIHATPSER